ncbi:Putative inner membrane protein [Alkalibacterium putridalgicola]|uniref:Putative inner membrane protein n=1 Tax=Alkalibacterium putridalgicola TaxID=426703 RepID=A0A1H7S9V4_9LACT|nr:DUF1819 family protein [Alkalibacterium putridalgicola]GEK89123.1 hypothetical protein APU01nite_11620 [Alkalibacterium putridalgicola]SEL69400.1 Putative inner membrane protein [Alkalibacterium putridalgicola]
MTKKYLTTLNTRPFLYRETKMVAELIDQGLSDEDIKEKVIADNLFQLTSKDRRTSFLSEIRKRLTNLDDFLLDKFLVSDTSTCKAILLYAILKKDTLFYEWMREVVWDKWLTLDDEVTKLDTTSFIETKVEQNETVAKWKILTRERLVNAYHQALVDAEYANYSETKIILQRPIISSQVEQHLKSEKEKHIVEVLLGEVIE